MSPYEIGVLLHYYSRIDDHESVERNPPIWALTRDKLIGSDLLRKAGPESDRTYELTARGRAYVEALQCVPLPEPQWVLPPFQWKLSDARQQAQTNSHAALAR